MRVYKFGLKRPLVNAPLVEEQLFQGHRYKNSLIEIEIKCRDAARKVLLQREDSISKYKEASTKARDSLRQAETELKNLRAETRRRADTQEMRAHVAALRERALEAYAAEKAARKLVELSKEAKTELDDIYNRAHQEILEARNSSGVFWGTYLRIEDAMDQSKRSIPLYVYDRKNHEMVPGNPQFRRWDGTGMVAVQLQRGLSASKVLECTDTRLQISLLPRAETGSKNSQKRRFGTVRLRVGSDGKKPIWAEWPLLMHRPLPKDAVLTWAVITRTLLAGKDRWELHLSLNTQDVNEYDKCGNGVVAVNFGWRAKSDGTRRVAYWKDSDGREGEFFEDARVLGALRKVEDLASIRATSFNELKKLLKAQLAELSIPEWLREAARYIDLWKGLNRPHKLLEMWKASRWAGDEAVFESLHKWCAHDRHLYQWETHSRDQALARRKDCYRNIAAALSRRYSTLLVDNFNLKKTQEHKLPEDEEVEIPAARLQQKDAAISEFRMVCKQAFKKRSGEVVVVGARMNTQKCEVCGCKEKWDAAALIEHTCSRCNTTWDQDANNVKNLLHRYDSGERSGGGEGEPLKKLSKWGRRGMHGKGARKSRNNTTEVLDNREAL